MRGAPVLLTFPPGGILPLGEHRNRSHKMKTKIAFIACALVAMLPAQVAPADLPPLPPRAELAEHFRAVARINARLSRQFEFETEGAQAFAIRAQAFLEVAEAIENSPGFLFAK